MMFWEEVVADWPVQLGQHYLNSSAGLFAGSLLDEIPLGSRASSDAAMSIQSGEHAGRRREEESFVREKRGYLLCFESTSGANRARITPAVSNSISMNISPQDFASSRKPAEKKRRPGIFLPATRKCFWINYACVCSRVSRKYTSSKLFFFYTLCSGKKETPRLRISAKNYG